MTNQQYLADSLVSTDKPERHRRSKRNRLGRGLTIVGLAAALIGGAAAVYYGSTLTAPEAPLPQHPFTAAAPNTWSVDGTVVTSTVPLIPEAGRTQTPTTPMIPDRLIIPALAVDSPVTAEQIDAGELTIPGDVTTVALWADGARNNQNAGTIVVAGHVNNRDQGDGALADLATIMAGDFIYLSADNAETAWQVVSLTAYAKDDLPAEIFAGETGARQLVLITCGGPFDADTGQYRDNVVVTAQPA